MREPHARLNAVALWVGMALFAALEGAAMRVYPGGTWWNARTQGHRFWENYLCDLEWRVALNGQPNVLGSRLAVAAMFVLILALAPFWLAVSDLCSTVAPATGRAVRWLGLASVAATALVVLMPSERFGPLHGVMVVAATVPGLGATGLAVRGLVLGEPRPRVAAAAGAATLACAGVDFGLYASHLVEQSEATIAVPALEKVALLFLLVWMAVVASRSGRARAS